jgi:hypothetical protein
VHSKDIDIACSLCVALDGRMVKPGQVVVLRFVASIFSEPNICIAGNAALILGTVLFSRSVTGLILCKRTLSKTFTYELIQLLIMILKDLKNHLWTTTYSREHISYIFCT